MKSIEFEVIGRPLTQGSMTPIRSKATGKIFMKHKKGLVEWRHLIAAVAHEKMKEHEFTVTDGPIELYGIASFARPRSHYRSGKYSHLLKDTAPGLHIQAPDGDKLMRALMDALTGVVYNDDGQVFDQRLVKTWIGRNGVPTLKVQVVIHDERTAKYAKDDRTLPFYPSDT